MFFNGCSLNVFSLLCNHTMNKQKYIILAFFKAFTWCLIWWWLVGEKTILIFIPHYSEGKMLTSSFIPLLMSHRKDVILIVTIIYLNKIILLYYFTKILQLITFSAMNIIFIFLFIDGEIYVYFMPPTLSLVTTWKYNLLLLVSQFLK